MANHPQYRKIRSAAVMVVPGHPQRPVCKKWVSVHYAGFLIVTRRHRPGPTLLRRHRPGPTLLRRHRPGLTLLRRSELLRRTVDGQPDGIAGLLTGSPTASRGVLGSHPPRQHAPWTAYLYSRSSSRVWLVYTRGHRVWYGLFILEVIEFGMACLYSRSSRLVWLVYTRGHRDWYGLFILEVIECRL
jgi:hypothetical protein